MGITVLLIGLIIVFPNIFGAIAAVIGVLIGLTFLIQKLDISIELFILIITFSMLAIGIIFSIMDYPKRQERKEKARKRRKEKEDKQQEKAAKHFDTPTSTPTIYPKF